MVANVLCRRYGYEIMNNIREWDFFKEAEPEKQRELLEFVQKIEKLKKSNIIGKHHVDGVGTLPSLRTSNYEDFDLRSCVHNWNSNNVGISISETHISNPIVDDKYEFIYFLLDNNSLIYVGRTVNLFTRVDNHASNKKFDSFKWLLVEKTYVDFLERYFIDKYRPFENRIIPRYDIPDIKNSSWMLLGAEI